MVSGDDIARFGIITQDFDMFVYENTSSDVDAINVDNYKATAFPIGEPYGKVAFTSSAPYITIRIVFNFDYQWSDNYKQVVLGFDLASIN